MKINAHTLLLVAAAPLLMTTAQTATITWTNASSGSWTNASNWDPPQVPAEGDTALIEAPGDYVVEVQGDVSVDSVVLGNSEAAPTLRVMAGHAGINSALTVANSLTNYGTIELSSTLLPRTATLNVTAGSLVNLPDATIAVRAADGGNRVLGAQLDNQGLVLVEQDLSINLPDANHLNHGTIRLANGSLTVNQSNSGAFAQAGSLELEGHSFSLKNGSLSFAPDASFTGPGILDLNSMAFNLDQDLSSELLDFQLANCILNGPGRFSIAANQSLLLNSCTVNADLQNFGRLEVRGTTECDGSFQIEPGATTVVTAGPTGANATFAVANGFTNFGTLELTSILAPRAATLAVAAGALVNAPDATLGVRDEAGGNRRLLAQLDNQGLLRIERSLTIDKSGVDHSNSGTIELTNADLTVSQSGSGTLTHLGSIELQGQTLSISGGSVTNAPGATLNGPGTIAFDHVTLNLGPDLSDESLLLQLDASTINGPGRLINALDRDLLLSFCTVNAELENLGRLEVRGENACNGQLSIEPGAELVVMAGPAGVNATLTVAGSFTNSGNLELTSTALPRNAALNVTDGALVNAPEGMLVSRAENGGNRSVGAQLDNQGLLLVEQNLSLNKDDANHLNTGIIRLTQANLSLSSGTFTNLGQIEIGSNSTLVASSAALANLEGALIQGNGTLDVSAAIPTFLNEGVIAPGLSPGILTVQGDLTSSPTALLEIELGGINPGNEHDQLAVTRTVAWGGTLNAIFIDGFQPAQYDTFTIARFASRTGEFENLNLTPTNRLGWAVDYTDTNVTLTVLNTPPAFSPIPDQTVDEGSELSLDLAASDSDTPAQSLSYRLLNAPPGATIDRAAGIFKWTPAEPAGPQSRSLTVSVTDDGAGTLTTTNSFNVLVREVNQPPALVFPESPLADEQSPISLTIQASDPDLPANTLSLFLLDGPSDATFDPQTGVLLWTPGEQDGPGTNRFTFAVTDSNPDAVNATSLGVTNTLDIPVRESNLPPILNLPPNQTVDEGSPVTLNATGEDPDLPPNPLHFVLLSGPDGLTVDPDTGLISWTPAESQGPESYPIEIQLTDDNPAASNAKSLSVTNSFTLSVNEVNLAPAWIPVPDQTIHAQAQFQLTLSATDADEPANSLAFELLSSPAGASLDPDSGLFTWFPTAAEIGTTNPVTALVSDNADPPLTDTNTFALIVDPPLRITSIEFPDSEAPIVTWFAIPGLSYTLQYRTNLADAELWTDIGGSVQATSSEAAEPDPGFNLDVPRFYRVTSP